MLTWSWCWTVGRCPPPPPNRFDKVTPRSVTLYLFGGCPGSPNAELGPPMVRWAPPMFGHEPPLFCLIFHFLRTNVQTCVQRYIQTILFTRIGCTPIFMVRILSVITFRYIFECLPDTKRSAAGPPNRRCPPIDLIKLHPWLHPCPIRFWKFWNQAANGHWTVSEHQGPKTIKRNCCYT